MTKIVNFLIYFPFKDYPGLNGFLLGCVLDVFIVVALCLIFKRAH